MLHPSYSVRPPCMLFFLMGITATPSVIKFCTSLELLRARGVTVPTADVTLSAVWMMPHSKVQNIISQQLQL